VSWILTITTADEQVDPIIERLWDLGTSGIATLPADASSDCRLLAGFDNEANAETAHAALGGTIGPVDPTDWATPTPADIAVGDHVLTIDAGQSFGHGGHPTTQLCLRALERHLRPGRSVLDVGSGSGVLAMAAKALGAGTVTAIDIDPAAVAATRANAAANGLSVDTSAIDIAELRGSFDLVVVNMLIAELEPIASHVRRLANDLIIVSGALVEQRDRVHASLGVAAEVIEQTVDGEWIGDTLRVDQEPPA